MESNKKRVFFFIVLLFILGAAFLFWTDGIVKKESIDDIGKIIEETQIPFPITASIEFVDRKYGLQSQIIYLKLKMSKSEWNHFTKGPIFDGINLIETTNVFAGTKEVYPKWRPQAIDKSISGIVTVTNRTTMQYLFDVSDKRFVVGYFAVGKE